MKEEFLKLDVDIEARTHETIYGTDDWGDDWEDEEADYADLNQELTVKDIIDSCGRYYPGDDHLNGRLWELEDNEAISKENNGDVTEVTVHIDNILPALCEILKDEYQSAIDSGYLSDNFDLTAKEESGITRVDLDAFDFGETDEDRGLKLADQMCLAISDLFKDINFKFNISGKLTKPYCSKNYEYH